MAKMQFIYLSESDMPVGTTLRWAIYLRSGELLAPAGFVVSDSGMQRRLMMATPVRAAQATDDGRKLISADEPAGDDKAAPQSNDPLRYLKHNAEGVVLTFQLPSDVEPRNAQVEFYGRVPMQSIIVSAPTLGLGWQTWQNFEGI